MEKMERPKPVEESNQTGNLIVPSLLAPEGETHPAYLAFQHASDRMATEFIAQVEAFMKRHQDSPVFATEEDHAYRVQRTLIGIGHGLTSKMPHDIRRAREGVLLVERSETGNKVECRPRWESAELPGPDILAIAKDAAWLFGQYDEEARELLCALIVSELLEGNNILPRFSLSPLENNSARWIWKNTRLEIKEEDYQAAMVDLSHIEKKEEQQTNFTAEKQP